MKDYSVNMEGKQVQENEIANKTETNIPPELPSKHPLEHEWTLWFYENERKNKWMDNLHQVYTFDTVEDFWCLYNHIKPVYNLTPGNDYALFKKGIEPTWEDPRNEKGGRWLLTMANHQKSMLTDMWLNVLLFMIGESFDDYSDEICGAYINIRGKHDKINLWTSDASKLKDVEYIGKKLKYDCLNLNDSTLTYEAHDESARRPGSREKPTKLYV